MKKNIWNISIIGNLIVILICLTLFIGDSLQRINFAFYDYDMNKSMTHAPHEDIIVVDIDQESLDLIGTFPWPRDTYIPLLEALSEAKAVAFDITFRTKSEDPAIDEAFAAELAKHDNVIIPSVVELENFFRKETIVTKDQLIKGQKLLTSVPPIDKAAKTAHINAVLDDDGVIRRTWLMLDSPEGKIPSLAYQVADMYGADVKHYLTDHPQTELAIKFDGSTKDFMNIPFYMVLNGEVPPETFKDRIVLVGMAAAGSDAHPTPVDNHMYLVYAHANIVNQLLHDQKITIVDKWLILALMLIVFFFTTWYTWRLKPLYSVSIVIGASILLIFGQFILFDREQIYLSVVYPLTALYVTFFVNIAVKTYFETKQKQFITQQFGRYISPELVNQIARSEVELPLGGVNKELSILFLDIRGFTPLSEKLRPEEVVDFLNMMFDMITNQVLQNHGTIDKFIGDAAMILYNAPLDVPHHEYYAVKTAFDIQRGMEQVRKDIMEKYEVEVSIGIGINTGEVVVGNIGSFLRVDYTAIGDHVNTAARIESNAQANQVLVSESTFERTKDYFDYQFVGEKMMKGKTTGIKLYEVCGHVKAPDMEQKS
ncbi:adenylate/guanylate cyclase domain-containing protein [Brevibacillus reuszeri]|uniref:Adenylate cyclase n=1 Tax=Brevibacillus reuszeri TaxID=54915 RepID=A0A0K9YKZ5_9BACL|nr:adenylate/guanylate cyclase domain-containing protein [Brevibacillus reuszeri]KNB69418.1 adenylate cyclase [Brevibacillus reuszeri]MED1860265.1 adenylate/guanylate cyclase domain-containing protein [Brevibacillus reuszeri]GED70846.1 adenylate/guanylate cyclase domain-containing protein [Brevibacillus reuszeri]